MAVVFRAWDEQLARLVALKIMAPALAADEVFRYRFIREWQAAAAVDDPHIIPVYEAGEAGGVLFLAMRLVTGGDVRSLVRRSGPLASAEAAAIISPVASALDAAHGAGLVHRDVKPANMLLDRRPGRPDYVYLSDFGLSKAALSSAGLTGTGQFLGTPNYTAPEQIQGLSADGRADQYALACAAFELLTGAPPFKRDQDMAVIWAHMREPPPTLSSQRPGSPIAADAVFARALAKAPQDRYASCGQFAEALRAALSLASYHLDHGAPLAAMQTARPSSPAAPAPPASVADLATTSSTAGPAATSGRDGPPADSRNSSHRRQPRPWRRRLALLASYALTALAAAIAATMLTNIPRHRSDTASDRAAARNFSYHIVNALASPGKSALAIAPPSVSSLAFSPDGKTLAITSNDGTHLWKLPLGRPVGVHRYATNIRISGGFVVFSPDSKTAATVGGTNNAFTYLWNVATGRKVFTFSDPDHLKYTAVEAVRFSPDGKVLATGDSNDKIYMWNLATNRLADILTDPRGPWSVTSMAFNSGGKILAVSCDNGRTYLWDMTTKHHSATLIAPNIPRLTSGQLWSSVAFSPSGKILAVSRADGRTYLWDMTTKHRGAALTDPKIPGLPNASQISPSAAFSPDGRALAVSAAHGITYVWNVITNKLAATLTDPESAGVTSVAFWPGLETLATGDFSGRTYLWQAG